MKTPRRRFLSLLGGALAACAKAVLREEKPPASGVEEAPDAGASKPEAIAGAGSEELFSDAPAPDDPLELLYSRRLPFEEGQPLITVRVAEGRREIAIEPRGPLAVLARTPQGETQPAVTAGAQGRWILRLLESAPGVGASWVELEQVDFQNKQALQKAKDDWTAQGLAVRVAIVGEAYGIAEPDPVSPRADGAIAHLNADHADALVAMAQVLGGYPDTTAATCTGV